MNTKLTSSIVNRNHLAVEKELCQMISNIVNLISESDLEVEVERRRLRQLATDDLARLAGLAELQIRSKEIKRIRKGVLEILKKSTNRMIVATLASTEN